jgi:hypothetical protein
MFVVMKDKELAVSQRMMELRQQISSLRLEESRHSQEILEALIGSLPTDTRAELVELLEALSEASPSGDRRSSDRRRALQIVKEVCRAEEPVDETGQSQYEPDRRVGERRQLDRRKAARNSGKPWSPEQVAALQTLVRQNVPVRRIGLKLGRSSAAILAKAKEMHLPLDPLN